MLAKVTSASVKGIQAHILEIETDIARGSMPAVVIVGLPDAAVKESRDRIKTACTNTGYKFPSQSKLTINLAPADIKKEGPVYDLPIALGILAASDVVNKDNLGDYAIIGELSLEGKVRPVKGVLSMAMICHQKNIKKLMLPKQNAPEAAVVEGIDVIPVEDLPQAVGIINNKLPPNPLRLDISEIFKESNQYEVDFAEVKGQEHAKRALTVAASGGHNIIMIGPPGSGKTMLAKRIPTILPELMLQESLETTRIHSVAGLLPSGKALITSRPFRSPHHTCSEPALIGGGQGVIPKAGEISLSHNGVLFLDELPEFHRDVLESLRQPLEDGIVSIGRASASISYPTKFMLVAAMNPCPCGFYGDIKKECHCSPRQVQRYLTKISGPLLDRIDIHLEVPAVAFKEIASKEEGTSSEHIRKLVNQTRQTQTKRFQKEKINTNAHMNTRHIKKYCKLDKESEILLKQAIDELGLSARAYGRILKVARTIADMENQENILSPHISEAIQYRSLDRSRFA